MKQEIIDWLLEGDVAIQYQVYRDLLDKERKDLRKRIATEGWGARFMSYRNPRGFWGNGYYNPKWKSSHYTLLDLRNLCFPVKDKSIQKSILQILDERKGTDGGINPAVTAGSSDVCVNGMFLNFSSYFKVDAKRLESIVDFLLSELMPDGGFNCRSNRSGAVHSSFHSTISVLEGISTYEKNDYSYRIKELRAAKQSSIEFLLLHQLYISDHSGEIINKDFLRLSYPGRWKYDILRALDYFQFDHQPWEERLAPAIEVLLKKRNKDLTWNVQAKWPGKLHFEMEKAGKPSRWNTLRAMRVLKLFDLLDN